MQWDEECNKSFEGLKSKLMKSPVLYALVFSQKFIVQMDASLYEAGIVLSQILSEVKSTGLCTLVKHFGIQNRIIAQ